MSNIIIFRPKSEVIGARNLVDFISFSEKLKSLNGGYDYNSSYWSKIGNFTKLGVNANNKKIENVLDISILPFAKAYVLYSQSFNKTVNPNEFKAIRVIEDALINRYGDADVTRVNQEALDDAAQIAYSHYGAHSAYQACSHLEALCKFLSDKKIIKALDWIRPETRPVEDMSKVGRKAAETRQKKLPDERALLAIAEIFSYGEEVLSPRDIFTTSSVALLMAAPSRGSELFYLPKNCLVERKDRDGNEVVEMIWLAGKKAGPRPKPIPSAIVPIVKEAVERLIKLGEKARYLAKEMEQRDEISHVDFGKKGYKEYKLKYSDALFTCFDRQYHAKFKMNENKLWFPKINTLSEDLKPTVKKRHNGEVGETINIFTRYGFNAQLKLKTHEIRHLLNTILNVEGVAGNIIASWSGRADETQNRVYNHMESEDYLEVYDLINEGEESNELGLRDLLIVDDPKSIQELNVGTSLTAHVTEFGVCLHDYLQSPCEKHRDCINCSEQVCEKGDHEKLKRLQTRLERDEFLLERDRLAVDEDYLGADRHYQKRLVTIERCQNMIAILTDDNIEDGSLIRLAEEVPTHLDEALERNYKKKLPKIKTKRSAVLPEEPKAVSELKSLMDM
ncbi:MAG: hypothetical protein HRU20_07795 [Pseudomonadales bacterium]|nr:hypothetical protein [Pseudomonadales bacterium]